MSTQVMGCYIRWSLVDRCKNFFFFSKWNGGAIGDFEYKKQHDLCLLKICYGIEGGKSLSLVQGDNSGGGHILYLV